MTPARTHTLVARRLWEAFSDADVELLRELLTPDVVWRTCGENPFTGEAKGVDETLELLARSGEGVDELRSNVRQIYGSADGAVIWASLSAERGPKSLRVDFLMLLRIAEGRVYSVSSVPVDQRRNDEFWRLQ